MLRLSDVSDRYRNLRAYHGHNYPALFFAVGAAKTLAQIGLVAGITWYGVSLATQPAATVTTNQTTQKTVTSPATTEITETVESYLEIEVPAVATLVPQAKSVNPIVPFTASQSAESEKQIFTSDWMMKQNPTSFTIQFATSPDKELLYRSAKSFKSRYPVIVFPFKRTKSNRPVYGFSSGIYANLEDAKQGILELPESAFINGPWVRPVSKIQEQIKKMSL